MKDDNPKSIEPRWLDRLFVGFPKLDRDGRIELFGRIETGAQGGVDYVVMMMLSSSLASLGLIEGATAVVIGAMLVAPLMGPLIGAGLALVQGNLRFFRKSIGVTFVGIGIALAVSACIGLINPGFEPSLEIEARGTPDLFDLAIAFVSGMDAAYASGCPNVAGTLAGVAIAAALVPPPCGGWNRLHQWDALACRQRSCSPGDQSRCNHPRSGYHISIFHRARNPQAKRHDFVDSQSNFVAHPSGHPSRSPPVGPND